jgi:iron complex outermembrane receptor protein
LQGKWVDDRFSTDLNDEVAPAYTVVDFDASYRFKLSGDQSLQVQFNVMNVLDEDYFGTISSGLGTNPPCVNESTGATAQCVNPAGQPQSGGVGFFSIGSPRTILLSVKYGF